MIPRRWLAAVALAAAAIALTFDPRLYINGDNIDYLLLARAVRSGHLWPSDKYPPLFPLLLAPVQALCGARLIPQKLLVLAFSFGSLWLLARIVRRRTDETLGPLVFLAAATLVPLVEYSHYTMSEIPYLFFFLGAIDACDLFLGAGGMPSGAPGSGSATAGAPAATFGAAFRDGRIWRLALWVAAAFYTRTAGVALMAGILVALGLGRGRGAALALAAALIPCGFPWLAHALATPGGSPYLRQLAQVNPYYPEFGWLTPNTLWRRLRENFLFYVVKETPVTVLPLFYRSTYSTDEMRTTYFPWWCSLPLLVPFVLGLGRSARRADPAAWSLCATLGVCLLWPLIWAGSRFLVPAVSLLLLFWWQGWEGLGFSARPAKRKTRRPPWLRLGLLAVLLLLGLRNLVFYREETQEYPPEWDRYFEALHWIHDHTPPDAVILDRKPGFVEYVAGRQGVTFPREKDADRMLQAFRDRRVTHVLLSSLPYDDIGRYLQPAVDQRREYFKMLYRIPDPNTYVLEFHPEGGVRHGPPATGAASGSAPPRASAPLSGSAPPPDAGPANAAEPAPR